MALASENKEKFEALEQEAQGCFVCPLSETRTTVVFGSGSPKTRVMFVGEAPGKNEDLGGKPFIGAAGKFLDELLERAGLLRDEVYIANVLKCRPPKNRDPRPDEIAACRHFLRGQVELIDPDVIITLGAFATREALHDAVSITAVHGTPHKLGKFTIFPVFHPAAALYDPSKREVLLSDFETLGTILKDIPNNA